MKRLVLFCLFGTAALALSACGARPNPSWPGLAADVERAYLASGSFVYAVRLSDGTQVWKYPEKTAAHSFISSPVLTDDGQLLVASAGTDNALFSLDPKTGTENWALPLTGSGNFWVASPLVLGQTVYAANNNGKLYAIELSTGKPAWDLQIDNSLWSAPTTNGTLIFVASLDHSLYAVDPETQVIAWEIDLGGAAAGSATVSSDGKTLYAGSFDKKVVAIDAASGSIQWAAELQDLVWSAPVQDGDTLYAADISGRLYSLGIPHGKNAWADLQPDGPITGSPLVLPDGMLVATESGTVFSYNKQGTKSWDISVGGKIYTTPVAAGDVVLIAPMNAEFLLVALNPANQSIVWKFTGR